MPTQTGRRLRAAAKGAKGSEPDAPLPPQAELDEKFQLARVLASRLWPWLSPALFKLVPRWTSGHEGVLTMAVDQYWRLYLCRRYVAGRSIPVLALLLACHELQHLVLGHMVRLQAHRGTYLVDSAGQQVELVNLANDLAINCRLQEFIDAAKVTFNQIGRSHLFPEEIAPPEGINYPKNFKDKAGKAFPDHLISEDYADLLEGAATHKIAIAGCRCGTGAGATPGSAPWEDGSKPVMGDPTTGVSAEEAEIVRQDVARQAAESAQKNQGTVPGHMRLWAETRLTPAKVRWEDELRRVIRTGIDEIMGRTDVTYSRPNRRTAGTAVILPGTLAYTPRLLLVFDTSGSMGPADYEKVFSEANHLIMSKATGARGVPCIACDAAADKVQWIRAIKDFKMTGGGGTDMMEGIHAAKRARGINPGLVIVLTDGYTSWDAVNPYPGMIVIAAVTNRDATKPPDWIRTVYACD